MWNYQEIISKLKPSVIIEFGTYNGGATKFFADTLYRNDRNGIVLSVDINHSHIDPKILDASNIRLLTASSTSNITRDTIRELREEAPGPAFIIIDSEHSMKHTLEELKLLRNLTKKGDYVVVEDTNINGHPVLFEHGPGPWEALEKYFEQYPNDYIRDPRHDKFGITAAPGGYLIRI